MSEYDVIVIGAGPGGYVAAIRAAQLGMSVACVEKEKVGGTCLNIGCIPSKTLLYGTELYASMGEHAKSFGITANPSLDFTALMQRKESVVSSLTTGVSTLFSKNRVQVLKGTARLTSPTTIDIDGNAHSAKYIILATGSEPTPLPFLPFDEKRIVSSTGALSLTEPPKTLAIIGGGIIGVEIGSVYARLGSNVHVIELLDSICPAFDADISAAFQKVLEKQGMTFHLGTKVHGANIQETIDLDLGESTFSADVVLVAIGRRPYTQGLGLDAVGLSPDEAGRLHVNGSFQTAVPSIYAIGDLIDGPMLAHKASEEGVAVAEILAGHKPRIEYMAIPNVVYTHPEVASVGLSEREAKEHGIPTKVGTFSFKGNARARCMGDDTGFIKMIAHGERGTIIGVHILGRGASELISEAALAIQKRTTAAELAATPHAHPTLGEGIKEAALAVLGRAIHQ